MGYLIFAALVVFYVFILALCRAAGEADAEMERIMEEELRRSREAGL